MSGMLRWTAVVIAITAAIDPSVTLAGRVRPTISLLAPRGSVSDTLRHDLGATYSIVDGVDPTAATLIVVGDRYPDGPIPDSARVATVTLPEAAGVRIASVTAPRAVPPATTIHLDAEVVAAGPQGRTTTLTASIGGAELARASHEWRDQSPWRASLDLVPIGEPPFVVTLAADGGAARATAVVDVSDRLPVLVYDARPSWTTTFVRRALENDPRFVVRSVGAISRGIAVRTTDAPQRLQATDLDRFRAVVVGGLDGLSASDSAALTQFMIERGGSVALIADSAAIGRGLLDLPNAGPGLQARAKEILLDRPTALQTTSPLPRIDASELLPSLPGEDATVLARTATDAIVWTTPRGEGHLLFSGALDAWRFRLNAGVGFDRFWQSAIAGLALAVRPPLSIDVIPPDRQGQEPRAHVRLRGADSETSVTATLASGEPVRLWPDPERGLFSGILLPSHPGPNRVDVVATSGGRTERASARFVAGAQVYTVGEPIVPLSLLSATHGGVDVTPDNMSELDAWLRRTVPAKTEPTKTHPMRSVWWIVPFAGCLCGEWWTRRRRGLR